jgi:hypothetical protein
MTDITFRFVNDKPAVHEHGKKKISPVSQIRDMFDLYLGNTHLERIIQEDIFLL